MNPFPRIVAFSGPLAGQTFPVDEHGVCLFDECVIRLCDGRAVAYSGRAEQKTPWCLLDHNARIDVNGWEFRLEHPGIDPAWVTEMFPAIKPSDPARNHDMQNFFIGLLLERISRPIAAAVLLDKWIPGGTAFATYFPGLFHTQYTIVNETRRQPTSGVYDDAERAFCARLSHDNRYLGALYVKCVDPFPLSQHERTEITRIASYISIFLAKSETVEPESPDGPPIGSLTELEIVFEDPPPRYHIAQKGKHPVLEQVTSTLEALLDGVVFSIFYWIDSAVGAAVCINVPERRGHFFRFQRPPELEIDRDIICRALADDSGRASNEDGTIWAMAIPDPRASDSHGKLGVVYMESEKSLKERPGEVDQLEEIARDAADDLLSSQIGI